MDTEKQSKQEEQEAAEGVQIRWDGSNMQSSYANVSNVSSTREEVTILFGTNKSWHSAHKELTVELSNRMVLNPYAAKRLSILLSNVIQGYEEQFGTIELELPQAEGEEEK